MKGYPCDLIEDLLPLYIEGDVSDRTKEIIEDHIKECYKCNLLIKEYSTNEIDIESFKEDLPQAKTFKGWMRRLKIFGGALVLIAIIIAIAIGAFGYKAGEKSKKNLLTLRGVVKTFKARGIDLKKTRIKLDDNYILRGVEPGIYKIGNSEDELLIYSFQSFGEKKEILEETDRFKDKYSFEEFQYHAKNILIIFRPNKSPEVQEELEQMGEVLNSISSIVFENLNEGQERIYKNESENWQGSLRLKYYEHWFEEDGVLLYDSYCEKIPSIKYKKSDIKDVGPISFQYEMATSKGSSKGATPNKEGYVNLGRSSSNGPIPSLDTEPRFKIKWGDKKEELILKAD